MKLILLALTLLFFLSCGTTPETPSNNPDNPDIPNNEEKITIPDDLSTITRPLVTGSSFSDGVSFIYKGDNKIQGDIKEGAIDDEIVSIIRGKVLDGDGSPIKKVRITINNHSEFGFTYTRADGEFDIAVNGDNFYNISYKKKGFITVQRKAKPEKNNFEVIKKIIMIPYSEKVTKIDLASITSLTVAKGDIVEDSDGKREAVMMFQPKTKATAILKDGTEVDLSKISIRATEFTVGDKGLEKMPALLPQNTGYTYAIELSIDEAGRELWRVEISHFTPYDCNWPYGCNDCKEPKIPEKEEDPCEESGSIINIHARTLGEVLPISGTGYSIFYNTSRVKGFKKANIIKAFNSINNDENLIKIEKTLSVAGKEYTNDDDFIWNGKDAYGRDINDVIIADLKLSYTYNAKYMEPVELENSFNNFSENIFIEAGRDGNSITLSDSKKVVLNNDYLKDQKLGGWSFGFHHKYYKDSNLLYIGSGKTIVNTRVKGSFREILNTKNINLGTNLMGNETMIDPILSNDMKTIYYFNNIFHLKAYDIGKKTTRTLSKEQSTDNIYESNALYYSNFSSISMIIDGKVKKVLNEYQCDGNLFHINEFVVNSDGEIYAIDISKNLLIKISQDGFVTKISGNCNIKDGTEFSDGDGESVYNANFNQISQITIDSNDNIYIMEKHGNIRQISKNGIVTSKLKFIENSTKSIDKANIGDSISDFYFVFCGGYGSSCRYLVKNDESSIFYDGFNVLFLDKNNNITKMMTTYNEKSDNVNVNDNKIQLINDKLILIKSTQSDDNQGFSIIDDYSGVISKDGSQFYYFDEEGKHIKTVDSLTGIELIKFGYNENGYLTTITDKNNNITTIERDSDDYATKIIAPFGQETLLDIDKISGYLNSLSLPMNRTYTMTYDTGEKEGLLKTFTKPNGGTSSFTYDDLGLLIKDTDAVSGFKEITQTGVEGSGKSYYL